MLIIRLPRYVVPAFEDQCSHEAFFCALSETVLGHTAVQRIKIFIVVSNKVGQKTLSNYILLYEIMPKIFLLTRLVDFI